MSMAAFVAAAGLCIAPASAPFAQPTDPKAAAATAGSPQENNWLTGQVRAYRAYPHLDKAYRLLDAGKPAEAQREFETYLRLNPRDENAQVAYLAVLYRLDRHPELIDRANGMLTEQPDWPLARIYRALALRAEGKLDAAATDLSEAGKSGSPEDREFALGLMVDVSIARQDYGAARAAFDRLEPAPKDYRYNLRQGLLLDAEQRPAEAVAPLRLALATAASPEERLTALRAQAENAKRRKDLEAARRILMQALQASPGDVPLMRELAVVAYGRRNNAEAIEWTQKVVQASPGPADREFLANLLFEDRRYREAIAEYERLLPQLQSDADRRRVLMAIGYSRQAIGDNRAAAEAFRSAARTEGGSAAVLAEAEALIADGDTAGAIAALEAAQTTPSSALVDARLGELYARSGDHARALQRFEAARHDEALGQADRYRLEMARGYSADALGRPREAIEAFRAALRLRQDAPTRAALAQAYENDGQTREAISLLEAAQAEQPSPALSARLGMLLVKAGEPQRALAPLTTAAADPALDADQRWRLMMARGEALGVLGRHRDAAAAFRAADEIRPDVSTQLALAQAYDRAGEPRAAIEALQQANARAPSAEIEARLGLAYARLGDEDRALRHLRASENLGDLSGEARYRALMERGYGHLQLKRNADAVRAFSAAAEMRPDGTTLLALAQAYEKDGRIDQAVRVLRPAAQQPGASDELRLQLGLLELKAGNRNRAEAPLRQASQGRLPRDSRRLALTQLGYLYREQGEDDAARKAFEQAAALAPDDPALQSALGDTYLAQGALPEAVRAFERSASLDATPSPRRSLALAHERAGDDAAAIRIYRDLLADGRLSPKERGDIWASLAYAYARQGDNAAAADAFRQALATGGGDERALRLALGTVLAKSKRWPEALAEYQRAYALQATPQTLLLIGRAYRAMGDDAAATAALEQAQAEQDRMTPGERRELFNELAYLYTEQGRAAEAVALWQQSIALGYDAGVAVSLGRAQRQAGDLDGAEETLLAIPAFSLTPLQQADRLEELAHVQADRGQLQDAVTTQAQALEIDPSPEREYQLAVYQRELGNTDEALGHYRAAAEADPEKTQYALDYGYALLLAGRTDDARAVFEDVTRREPDDPAANEQLGYLYLRSGDNAAAEASFVRAIDGLQAEPPAPTPDAELARRREVETLRREVTNINRTIEVTGYQQYRSNSSNQTGGTATVLGLIQSNGGVELAWRPPVVGLNDGRVLQVFTRYLWANKPDAFGIQEDSWQGGVGVRYKPLREQNLYVSLEKLFEIGDASDNNTLLRGQYGWERGTEIQIGEPYYNYTSLYTDLGFFMEKTRNVVFYGEARQGVTFNIKDRLTVSPHVILDGRTQYRDNSDLSYVEGGAGVAVRLPFLESTYESYRSSVEGVIQYRQSIDNSQSGFVFTGLVRF